jgi:tetratricopeptide (TPR) repeat protein
MSEEDHEPSGIETGAEWALSAAGREAAETFLKEQTRLARLQADGLEREEVLRHWSLRVHHAGDVLKLAFEFAIAFIVLAIVVAIAAGVLTASQDSSLVIEAFSVPPDMAARGVTGHAAAAQLLDKLSEMQDATQSGRAANSYASNWGDDIKVQIPDTGVSVGEVYRALVLWLGHQSRITGEVYRTANGIAITVRASGAGSATVSGDEANLNSLLQQTAETIYARTQPYRYSKYLEGLGEYSEAMDIARKLTHGPAEERPWAWVQVSNIDLLDGRYGPAVSAASRAAKLEPQFNMTYLNRAGGEEPLGWGERTLSDLRVTVRLSASNAFRVTKEDREAWTPIELALIADYEGDLQASAEQFSLAATHDDFQNTASYAPVFRDYERARDHDLPVAAAVMASLPLSRIADYEGGIAFFPDVAWAAHSAVGDWQAALADMEAAGHAAATQGPGGQNYVERWALPLQAQALAMLGRKAEAMHVAGQAPLDCDLCLRMRGVAAASAGDWTSATRWFSQAEAFGPSLPFTDTDWGEMLLRKGDFEGAIAKFKIANQKGPHFADPLEMWGEALMLKNHSDLALAKFTEADKYAPKWGRLHLKWGEALVYAGKKHEARAQYGIASSLDLSAADKAVLARQLLEKAQSR